MKGFYEELFVCDCGSVEHQIIVTRDEDDDEFVYLSVHLAPIAFYRRLGHAIRYLFGHRSVFGDFQETMLSRDDAERLAAALRSAP